MSDLFLEILEGPGKGGAYRLLADTALVGRGPDCDIRLDNVRGVSRQHCRLYVMDGTLRVQDLGSQNGVVINGKKISDVIIKPGVAMKIGEAVLALRRDDPTVIKSAIARTVDSGSVPGAGETVAGAPAPVPAPPPVGMPPAAARGAPPAPRAGAELSNLEQAQELMEAAGRSSKGILLGILVLVAIVFAGLYLVHLVSLSKQASRDFIIVKAHEEKAVDLGVNCKKAAVVCDENSKRKLQGRQLGTVAPYRGLLAEPLKKLYGSNPNVPKRNIMVLKGDVEGEGWVQLQDEHGNPLRDGDGKELRRRLLCRGLVPRAYPENIAGAEAVEQARLLEAEGDVLLRDGRYYDASKKFRLASQLFSTATGKQAKEGATACDDKVIDARTRLAKQLQDSFVNGIATAFPLEARTNRNPDFSEALILLDQAKTMIPDSDSVDRQVIEIWQDIIGKAKKKRKAAKGA